MSGNYVGICPPKTKANTVNLGEIDNDVFKWRKDQGNVGVIL